MLSFLFIEKSSNDEGDARAEIVIYKIFEGALTGSLPR